MRRSRSRTPREMTSCWLTLTTLVALVAYVSSHTTDLKQPSRSQELASALEHIYDDAYDLDAYSDSVEKRDRTYGFGLGKRGQDRKYRAYGFGLGKRDRSYRSYGFGLGKRSRTYGFGLGKRQPSYAFGLGKRAATSQYAFGLGKRSAYDTVPEKRQAYGFGLGKRSWSWFDGPMRDVLKRPSYGFGLGKRSAPAEEEDDSMLEDRLRSKTQTETDTEEVSRSASDKASIEARYQP